MSDPQAPGGYFIGRPANYEDKQQDAADAQNTGSAAGGGNQGKQQAPASGDQKKAGFFGNLFSCISGGRAES